MSVAASTRPSLLARLAVYQRERFPLAAYVPLIAVATLAGAAYSRAARGVDGLPSPAILLTGGATLLVAFLLLRVLDEHKDAAIDRRWRPELPVPRGLVTLAELRAVAGAAVAAVLLLNAAVAPALLWLLAPVGVWMAFMTREFFAPEWLRARPTLYLLSHMVVMPLLFAYATGLDWLAAGAAAPQALLPFLALALLNGLLIEIGRKIRAPGDEREGVETYTKAWGARTAPLVWIAMLVLAAGAAAWALIAVGSAVLAPVVVALAAGAGAAASGFLRVPAGPRAERIETAAGLWTLLVYLLLGAAALLA